MSIDSKPQASGILDTIYVARAHGIKTPAEFQDLKVLRTLETAVVHEWYVTHLIFLCAELRH